MGSSTMKGNITKKSHYVFRAYLKPWASGDAIYCLRKHLIFKSNLTGIACERFFYRLQDLTQKEQQLIEEFFSKHPSESLKAMQKRFMELYLFPTRLREQAGNGINPKFSSALNAVIAEGQETLHQIIEDDLIVFLKRMLAGDTDFYSDNKQAAVFLHALAAQFTRTKRTIETAVALVGAEFNGCDMRRIMAALSPLMAMAVGQGLYVDRERFKLVIINNDTDTPFITADQPIINFQAGYNCKPPEKLEFYYPLSPNKAMLLLEISSKRGDFPVTAVSVNNYNTMIAMNSYEQIFSNSEPYLESVRAIRLG